MSCPHYTETERTVGFLTELVCRDCNARLAPAVVETEVGIEVATPDFGDEDPYAGRYVETQAVLNEAYELGILEEPLSADGVESARIEDDTLIETFAPLEVLAPTICLGHQYGLHTEGCPQAEARPFA